MPPTAVSFDRPGPRNVAILLWIVAGVELLLFTCCGLVLTAVAVLPVDDLTQALGEQMPADQLEQMLAMRSAFAVMAVVQTILVVLPALALVVLAFGVMRAKRYAITGSRVIVAVHVLLVSLLLILGVSNSVTMGDVPGLLFNALLFGALDAGLIYAFVWLGRLRAAHDPDLPPSW